MKTKEIICPVAETSKVIGDHWNIVIIKELLTGAKRFSELKASLDNITSSTLSDKLKFLSENQIIIRKQFKCIPPKVEYSLTQKGLDFKKIIKEIERFGQQWLV